MSACHWEWRKPLQSRQHAGVLWTRTDADRPFGQRLGAFKMSGTGERGAKRTRGPAARMSHSDWPEAAGTTGCPGGGNRRSATCAAEFEDRQLRCESQTSKEPRQRPASAPCHWSQWFPQLLPIALFVRATRYRGWADRTGNRRLVACYGNRCSVCEKWRRLVLQKRQVRYPRQPVHSTGRLKAQISPAAQLKTRIILGLSAMGKKGKPSTIPCCA